MTTYGPHWHPAKTHNVDKVIINEAPNQAVKLTAAAGHGKRSEEPPAIRPQQPMPCGMIRVAWLAISLTQSHRVILRYIWPVACEPADDSECIRPAVFDF
jgi:hypothetical protein